MQPKPANITENIWYRYAQLKLLLATTKVQYRAEQLAHPNIQYPGKPVNLSTADIRAPINLCQVKPGLGNAVPPGNSPDNASQRSIGVLESILQDPDDIKVEAEGSTDISKLVQWGIAGIFKRGVVAS